MTNSASENLGDLRDKFRKLYMNGTVMEKFLAVLK